MYFVDGAYVGNAAPLDLETMISVDRIESIEAYDGGGQIPVLFNRTGGSCGVIAFWKRP
jgi:hypothetical protein